MDKVKKIWKELSVFGICIICFLGLYAYRVVVKADYSTTTKSEVVRKLETGSDFVLVASSSSSGYTPGYLEVVETYLTKNRGDKIYYLDLDQIDDADEFAKTYLGEEAADLENPSTYVFIDGEIYKSKDAALGYYDLTKLMTEFKEAK